MTPMAVPTRSADARSATRSSLFLGAALFWNGSSSPIKIRNLSSGGALIEGSVIPTAGSLVQVVRGALVVHGLVAWTSRARFGIKFSGSIDVQQWRAPPGNGEQQRVDEIV